MSKGVHIPAELTIVIPVLNEKRDLPGLLANLAEQEGAAGLHVYIADGGSTDGTQSEVQRLSRLYAPTLHIFLVPGGTVSRGRNSGLGLVSTPLVLFLDGDVGLPSATTLFEVVSALQQKLLVTAPIRSRSGGASALAYRAYSTVARAIRHWRPFALGSFFATHTDFARSIGGFREDVVHSEDWLASKHCPPSRFLILPRKSAFTVDDRRFAHMGYGGMVILLLRSLLQGESYMKKDNGYWKIGR